MEDAITTILKTLGEDPTRPGLKKTPARVAKALKELTSGYDLKLEDIIGQALFPADTDGLVIVKNIECYSLCEHHLLPFVGKVHVGYVPDQHILGLSKIARVVDMYARRLQVQERLTQQICDALETALKPKGIGVIIEAEHFCMMMRGVGKQHSAAVTSCVKGLIKTDEKTRLEWMQLIKN